MTIKKSRKIVSFFVVLGGISLTLGGYWLSINTDIFTFLNREDGLYNSSNLAFVSPSPTSSPLPISTCMDIKKPGQYLITKDIVNTKAGPCINIQNMSNVSLSCQNYSITSKDEDYGIYVKNSTDFKINNCKLLSSRNVPVEISTQHMFRVEGSKRGEIYLNKIKGNYMSIDSSSKIKINNNTIENQLTVYKSDNISIYKNNFSHGVTPIILESGYSNSVTSNNIDGKSDGLFVANSIGADDGIMLKDEKKDLIQDNKIYNVFDCGIENVGYVFESKIIRNYVKNAGVCMFGGWYYSSLKGNLIKDNIGDDTPKIFLFRRSYALKPQEKYVYFKDNIFDGNRLINPRVAIGKGGGDVYFPSSDIKILPTEVPASSIVVGNNVFKNNDFNKNTMPSIFIPSSMIVDGGGNICSTTTDKTFPLKCN